MHSSLDAMSQYYSEDNRVLIIENFDEINQPFSCEQWGLFADENLPIIFTDNTPSNDFFLWDMFTLDCSSGTIVIDHNMKIRYVLDYFPENDLYNTIIPELLFQLEDSRSDINGDGLINILDIISLANIILFDNLNTLGDINQDGEVNLLDIMTIISIILES